MENTLYKYLPTVLAASIFSFSSVAVADLSEVPSGKYSLDKNHGYITFSYSHLGLSNPHVGFDNFDVILDLDVAKPENSKVVVEIDATSVDSRVATFNEHLNGEDFFATSEYPEITFKSTGIKKLAGVDTFEITGDLTIKGKTVPVTLAAKINKAAPHPMRKVPAIGVSGEAKVSRSDWGLDRYVPNVSDEVTISIEAELLQAEGD
jgi:polyisoprenoid-binding protein YceI